MKSLCTRQIPREQVVSPEVGVSPVPIGHYPPVVNFPKAGQPSTATRNLTISGGMPLLEILRLRFIDRDKAFVQTLNSIKAQMNARGLFHSGATIKHAHDALRTELAESRKTILLTISEDLNIARPSAVDKSLGDNAVECLNERRVFLESLYLENMRAVFASLKNIESLKPYMGLSSEVELNDHELRRELAQEIQRYLHSRGATLYERLKNQFFDRPLVVVAVIAMAAVTAILAFLASIRVI